MPTNQFLLDQIAKGNDSHNDSTPETLARVGGNDGWMTWIAALLSESTNALSTIGSIGGALPLGADYIALTYVGSTNNVSTVVYKSGGSGGTVLATLTMTYVASGAADDDDLASVTLS